MNMDVSSYPLKEFPRILEERLSARGVMAALVDPVQWGDVDQDLIRISNQWTLLYKGEHIQNYYKVMPYSVFLQREDPLYPEFLRRIGTECSLVVELDDSVLRNAHVYIRSLMQLSYCLTPDGQKGFLRYYDPSIFMAFLSCASPDQAARLFGDSISSFWCEDAYRNKIYHIERPENLPKPCSGPLKLSPEQMEKLLEAQYEKYAQMVETEIRKEFYPGRDQRFLSELNPKIRAALDAAERYSYLSRKEGYQFVRAAARHGWDFYEREPFQKLLSEPGLSRRQKLEALRAPAGANA